MQCPNCQHWNEPGSRFCEECGHELTAAAAKAPAVKVTYASASEDAPPPPPQVLVPAAPPAMAAPAPLYSGARLVLQAGGSIFKLGDVTLIGRADPTLQIDFEGYPDGQYISNPHAQITKLGDLYYVEDLDSNNASYVNDRKLARGQAEPLKEGDVVRFGKITLTFHH